MVIGSVVTLISASNLSRVNEVQICCQDCQAFRPETRESRMTSTFIFLYQIVNNFQFGSPCNVFWIHIKKLIDKILSILTTTLA